MLIHHKISYLQTNTNQFHPDVSPDKKSSSPSPIGGFPIYVNAILLKFIKNT